MPTARQPVRIGLMGGFALAGDGAEVAVAPSAQRLIAFLALQRRPLERAYVAGTLWLDASQASANARLRTALWRAQAGGLRPIRATATHVALAEHALVDVHAAAARAERAIRDPAAHADADLRDLSVSRELLPDWSADWLTFERERWRQLRLHALEALALHFARSGEHGRAVVAASAAVAGDPLRESAHRCLIEALLAEGNWSEALRQYDSFARLLRRELGLAPSRRMRGLVAPLTAATAARSG
jgi:DNA-binding SARP family transcriptional activator